MSEFYQRKDISKDTIEFTITIPKDSFETSYKAMMKDRVKDVDIKGFRKGKVPTNLVEPQINQSVKLETLEKIAPLFISTAIQKEQLDPIAPPEYKELPKLEDGKDIELTITVTVMPEFKLANLKKVKVEKEEAKISKEEIEQALDDIKKNYETKEKEINDAWALGVYGRAIGARDYTNMLCTRWTQLFDNLIKCDVGAHWVENICLVD